MFITNLIHSRTTSLQVRNDLKSSMEVSLSIEFSHAVDKKEDSRCNVIDRITIADNGSDEERLRIELVVESLFKFNEEAAGEIDGNLVHNETLMQIYPHLRTLIASMTMTIGMSPLYISQDTLPYIK